MSQAIFALYCSSALTAPAVQTDVPYMLTWSIPPTRPTGILEGRQERGVPPLEPQLPHKNDVYVSSHACTTVLLLRGGDCCRGTFVNFFATHRFLHYRCIWSVHGASLYCIVYTTNG